MTKKKGGDKEVESLKNFRFLSDKALEDGDQISIRFGHEKIAEALLSIVEKTNPPFTIGLYGGWGSGKTTIVNLLQSKLVGKKIKTVYFDVWKFQKDSLRRQFLLESAKQLKQKGRYKRLKTAFYVETSEQKEVFSFKWKKGLVKVFPYVVNLFFLTFLFLALVFGFGIHRWREVLILTFGGTVGTITFLELISKLTKNLLVVDEKTLKTNVLAEPERFMEEFKKILSASKQDKILFVFDNLDRTYDRKAVELLTTTKTFLGEDKCVFLVPCDERAIRKHVVSSYLSGEKYSKKTKRYAEEFLRKFFDTVVWIPKFEDLDLDEYTKELLAETCIDIFPKDQDLIRLITYVYRDNPREIKQFINMLISLLLLVKSRIDDEGVFSKNVLEKDVSFVAKMLVLKQIYPDAYIDLEELALKSAKSWVDIEEILSEKNYEDGASKFISDTSYISPEGSDLVFYLTLTTSKEEEILSGWTPFAVAAADMDVETAGNFLKTFDRKKLLGKFDSLAFNFLRKYKNDPQKTKPFVSTCVRIFSQVLNRPITVQLAKEIVAQINLLKIDSIDDFPIAETITMLKPNVGTHYNARLAKKYVSLLGTTKEGGMPAIGIKNAIDQFSYIASDPDYFETERKRIVGHLAGHYCLKQYLEFFAKPNLRRKFIDDSVVTKYIDRIGEQLIDSPETLETGLSLIQDMKVNLEENHVRLLVTKLQGLISKEAAQEDYQREQKMILVDFLNLILKKYPEFIKSFSDDDIKSLINSMVDSIVNWFNQIQDWKKRSTLFKLAVDFKEVVDDPQKSSLENSIIKTYVRDADYAQGYSLLKNKDIKLIVNSFGEEFVQASTKDVNILSLGHKFLSDSQVIQVVVSLLNSSKFDEVINFIEGMKKSVVHPDQIITLLFDKLPSMHPSQKEKVFTIAYKLKCANNPGLVERFFNELKAARNTDSGKDWIRKFARGNLFSLVQKSELKEKKEE